MIAVEPRAPEAGVTRREATPAERPVRPAGIRTDDMPATLRAVDRDMRQPVIRPRLLGDDLCKRAIDLTTMVQAAAARVHARDALRPVQWLVAPGMRVYADPGLLRQVLECLLGNAFRFSVHAAPARIEVTCRHPVAGRVEIQVRDNGIGFDTQVAQNLLAPMRRFRDLAVPVGERIDLATVRCIVERHGGFVKAEGAPGIGATFTLSLPDWSDITVGRMSAGPARSAQDREWLAQLGRALADQDADAARTAPAGSGGLEGAVGHSTRRSPRVARMVDEATRFMLPGRPVLLAMVLIAGAAALLLAR